METMAIILAGGRSSRMGENKALMKLGGITVIEKIIRELEPVAARIVVVADDKEAYRPFGKEVVTDMYNSAGPLAGLHAGLANSASTWNIAVACDTPFANRGLFQALLRQARQSEAKAGREGGALATEAVIARTGERVHPLLAVYRRSVLPGLERELRLGRYKMTAWLDGLRTEYADGETLAAAAGLPQEWLAFNMNRPEDYEKAKAWLEKMKGPL